MEGFTQATDNVINCGVLVCIPLEVQLKACTHGFMTHNLVHLLHEASAKAIGRTVVEDLAHISLLHLAADRVARAETFTADTPELVFQESEPGCLIKVGQFGAANHGQMRQESADSLVNAQVIPPLESDCVSEPAMTQLVKVAEGKLKALGQSGLLLLPNVTLVKSNGARRWAVSVHVLCFVSLDNTTCYTADVLHGEIVVLRDKDLTVLPVREGLACEVLVECDARLNHIKHLSNVDLVNY